MTLSTSEVAACCSSASSRSRLVWSSCLRRLASDEPRRATTRAAWRLWVLRRRALPTLPPVVARRFIKARPPDWLAVSYRVQASTLVGARADVAMDCRLNAPIPIPQRLSENPEFRSRLVAHSFLGAPHWGDSGVWLISVCDRRSRNARVLRTVGVVVLSLTRALAGACRSSARRHARGTRRHRIAECRH